MVAAPSSSSPPRPSQHKIDLPPAAARAHQPRRPIRDRGLRAIALGQLCGVGFDLMLARLASHDHPHLRRGSAAERRGWVGSVFHDPAELLDFDKVVPATPSTSSTTGPRLDISLSPRRDETLAETVVSRDRPVLASVCSQVPQDRPQQSLRGVLGDPIHRARRRPPRQTHLGHRPLPCLYRGL